MPSATQTNVPLEAVNPTAPQSATKLRVTDIIVDESLQSRAKVNSEVVAEYAERMNAGDKFPPPHVFRVDGKNLLAAGFHTVAGLKQAGYDEIEVILHTGTRAEALKHSLQSNLTHGVPRTNEDKRRAATLALHYFPGMSDGVIADMIKVSQPFVSTVHRKLEKLKTVMSSGKTKGRDGKERKTRKPKKGAGDSDSSDGKQPVAPAQEEGAAPTEARPNVSCASNHPAPPVVEARESNKEDGDESAPTMEEPGPAASQTAATPIVPIGPRTIRTPREFLNNSSEHLTSLRELSEAATKLYNIRSSRDRKDEQDKLILTLKKWLEVYARWESAELCPGITEKVSPTQSR